MCLYINRFQSLYVNFVLSGDLTLLHSERPKLHRLLAFLSAIGLTDVQKVYGV